MKNLTWQNPEQLFVAQVLINQVKSKCCGIKVYIIMGKIKPQVNKLSQGEADTISNFVKMGLDIIVKLTGGKPSFGDKK